MVAAAATFCNFESTYTVAVISCVLLRKVRLDLVDRSSRTLQRAYRLHFVVQPGAALFVHSVLPFLGVLEDERNAVNFFSLLYCDR